MATHARPKPQQLSLGSRAPADPVVVGDLSQLHARNRIHISDKLTPFIPGQVADSYSEPFGPFSSGFLKKKCPFHPETQCFGGRTVRFNFDGLHGCILQKSFTSTPARVQKPSR
jgi:hypothetical protein